ncbi:MAG: SHOCT domain-containing protein [Alphaproteobacteria bacterium]
MKRILGSAAALATTLAVSLPAWAQQQGGPYYSGHMWDGGPWMFMGPLMMIAFLAVIVVVVVLVIRWVGGPAHHAAPPAAPGKAPVDILKERFARGEIDKEEFEERRRVLGE